MDVSNAIACAALKEGMSDLYQKIDKYLYEMRMIELEGYLYGMNRQKIDEEKAYDIIIDAHDSEWNPVTNVWKARLADPEFPCFKSSRVEKNESIANAFCRRAVDLNIEGMAEAGDQYACVCLGWMYDLTIEGMGIDLNKYARLCFGEMYEYGRGVRRNDSTAVKWYRKAAEQGHADAHFYCGIMIHLCGIYEYIYGGYRNHLTKFECYCKAAEQGHAFAQYCLGDMYYLGDGVDQNYSTAVEWFRKAAEQGHAIAQRSLDRLTKKRRIVEKFDDLGLK